MLRTTNNNLFILPSLLVRGGGKRKIKQMKFVISKSEPAQEGLFLTVAAAVAGVVGIKWLINKINDIREQKNPTLIIDSNYGKLDFNRVVCEYPTVDGEKIELNPKFVDDFIDVLRDSDGWYHPSKGKFIPCQPLEYWKKHYTSVVSFVTSFAKLYNADKVAQKVQQLSDSVFGQNGFIGNKYRASSITSRYRLFPIISDKKNGHDNSSLLGFPNDWYNDKNHAKGDQINALRQKVVDAVCALKQPIEYCLNVDGKSEEQLKNQLEFLRCAVIILYSLKHDITSFDYDASQYTETIDMIKVGGSGVYSE
jgi:hypothetical protein